MTYSIPHKQNINTKISTEAEVVRIDDLMLKILWTYHLFKSQGIIPNKSIEY